MVFFQTKEKNMRDLIAVFQSRKDAMQFGMMMTKRRVRAQAIGTPSSVGSSCGLSIRFPGAAIGIARQVLSYGEFQSFNGFYEI